MKDISNSPGIDISEIRWGYAPVPLLPRPLREEWALEPLPTWVSREVGLPDDSTVSALGGTVWESMEQISSRLKHFLVYLVRSRSNSIRNIRILNRNWPVGLKPSSISLSTRTRNCLSENGLLLNTTALTKVTFGTLFDIEAMGALSVLEFASTIEGVMDFYDQFTSATSLNSGDQSQHEGDLHAQMNLPLSNPHDKQDYAEESGTATLIRHLEETLREEWVDQVSEVDPRFAPLLPPGKGTLQERVDKLLSEPDSSTNVTDLIPLANSIQKIRESVERLKEQPLDRSLLDFLRLLSRTDGERLEALAARFGWTGKQPATLEECAQMLGLTRERIRQLQQRIVKRIPDHPVYMPRLDQALELLEEHAPMTADKASHLLLEGGVVSRKFHPQAIIGTAGWLHRDTTLSIHRTPGGEVLTCEPNTRKVQLIPRLARKLAGQSGTSSIYQVLDALEDAGFEAEEQLVRRILMNIRELEFLDEDWFWATDVKDSRNRLVNATRRILSAVSPQTLLSIRDGIRRHYRWRTKSHTRYHALTVPPLAILKDFYDSHQLFTVEEALVHSTELLDYRQELGDTERVLVEVIRSSPAGILDRLSFAERCLAKGMNENTFNIYTTYSVILEHLDLDIWKLRGTRVDSAAVAALRSRIHTKPKQRRVLQYGWSSDGNLWIAARIPKLASSMILGCPSPIQRYLIGQEFIGLTKEGHHKCGVITINDKGMSYGYTPFIRRYGLDENDVLLAEFDLNTQTVTLGIAGDELIYEYL